MSPKYDLVVYGASGFTGQYVVEYVHRAAVQYGISWAVAGRNEGRLHDVLSAAGRAVSADLSGVPVLVCDCSDSKSLEQMARKSRVLLNCVGPYRFYGEAVVEACVEAGAHHVDISGEPAFLEKMQLKYHQKAVENGVYVVGSCGFDSIPSDVGQMCVRKEMKGDMNSVETFLSVEIPPLPGAALNFGTWQSAIYGFAYAQELKSIRRSLYPEKLPGSKYRLKPRGKMFYCPEVGSYCMPFLGSDRSVMLRTQREIFHVKEEAPAQVQCYVEMSRFNIVMTMLVGLVFGILASFKFGRSLLENYPGVFSLGAVSKQGVPKAKADETNFTMTLLGKGWESKGEHSGPPTRTVKTVVKGKNVGYGATCECMVQAGLVILQELDRLPSVGGVYTPGIAFAETTLVDRLHKRGVTFDTTVQN
jgi:short subunit dehydrogenase-like uncharacterized protein